MNSKKPLEDYELQQAALTAVTDSQRKEIFECLKAAYGNEFKLYSRIWHTRSPLAEEDTEGDEFEVTDANADALEYCQNRFLTTRCCWQGFSGFECEERV